MVNTLPLTCTVVVADDGHHAVVQAEDRHIAEILQLDPDPVDRGRRRGIGQKDLIDEETDDGRQTHGDDGRL